MKKVTALAEEYIKTDRDKFFEMSKYDLAQEMYKSGYNEAKKTKAKAKVRVTGNYVSRISFTNRIDTILNLPVNFTEKDIVDNIDCVKYSEGYSFKEIEILCVYDDDSN